MFYETTRHNLKNTKSFFSQMNERCFAQLIEWLIVWLKENGQDQMQRGFNLHFSENVKFYCWTSDVSSTHNQGKTVSRIISIKISVKDYNNCRQFRPAVTGVCLTLLVICPPWQILTEWKLRFFLLGKSSRQILTEWKFEEWGLWWSWSWGSWALFYPFLTLFAYGDISHIYGIYIPQTYCNPYNFLQLTSINLTIFWRYL